MTFIRQEALCWHREVPGARWFKTDLHIHTIDDRSGGRVRLPSSIEGSLESESTVTAYARCFLQSAVKRGVRVIGITPHSPRDAGSPDVSAVWRIVEEWNEGFDTDGTPFRDKIYAVFPGFEPSLKQGKSGLHLLFLFDPEVGRENYLKTFDLVMDGVNPWIGNELQLSNRSAEAAFRALREFHKREWPKTGDGANHWSYIVLAPHIENEKGLLGAQKAQVLQLFQHEEVAGLELGDKKLPADTVANRAWLSDGMAKHRQAFFHGSDAYAVDEIGNRHTWLKLASPRIEALRQAFIASDSRMRLGYERNTDGNLTEIPAPDVTVNERPWLKSVTIKGGASFFGETGAGDGARFDLSPDLTCIVGGSMTGKSTFLDGLRVLVDAPLPQDKGLKAQIEARGRDRFLAGSPKVVLECPGQDPTALPHARWPASFHAQNELQRLAQDEEAVEDILAHLVASETDDINTRKERLNALDRELSSAVGHLGSLNGDMAEAEQACERSRLAASNLHAFSEAGIEDLHRASRDHRIWLDAVKSGNELAVMVEQAIQTAASNSPSDIDDSLKSVLGPGFVDKWKELPRARWERVGTILQSAMAELSGANAASEGIASALGQHEQEVRIEVDRSLAAQGLDGAKIKEFRALSSQASLLESYEANLEETREKLARAEFVFESCCSDRQGLVDEQRAAFDRVIEKIREEFAGRICPGRISDGNRKPLAHFLKGLGQKGVTRWWNDLSDDLKPAPLPLLDAMQADELATLGMSTAVEKSFNEAMSQSKRWELASLRCRDRYVLELRLDDGNRRRLDDLSGGQRVSVLLSLLLETSDERPLVIDQPEDELDNRFLFDTVLPALKRLKGRRQVVVSTHNANIVVNGDADQVIQLEATANRGWVAEVGAIEEPSVRDAIVRTVDGGDEAFRLRRLKYGF